MLRILAAALFALLFTMTGGANAQQAIAISSCGTPPNSLDIGAPHVLYMDSTGVLCTSSSGAGGGGTSKTDASAFTAGTTAVTPSAGLYNDSATLSSGQVGAPRLTNKRAQVIDVDTTSSALYSAITAAIPPGTNTIGNVGSDPSQGKGTPASAAISVSTATTTQLVAISGTTKIYVTSYDVIAAGTGNITFVYGTGSSCGTGTTSLTGAYNLTAQAGVAKGNGQGAVLVVPAGNALCVTTSAAVQMSGSVSYQQF